MLSYLKYLKYLFFKKYPAEITFFITAACNFRCRHCFNLEKILKANPEKELSLDEIDKITQTIPPFLRLSLSGGEPFLRADLARICQLFYKNCQVEFITIPTNASLPEKIAKDTEQIVKSCQKLFLNISLSLDGLGKNRDNIVGRGNTYISLLKTAQEIKNLKRKYPNLGLGVITTQIPENENQLDEIYEFVLKALNADNFGFNIVRVNTYDKKEPQANLEIYERFTQKLINEKRQPMFNFAFSVFFNAKKNLVFKQVLKIYQRKKYLIPCFSGNLRVVIDEVGNVYPCETLQYRLDNQKFLMGNLRDYDFNFKNLFFSPKAREIKNHIKKTKCFCAHECDLETNILFNPKFIPRLLFEALRIKLKL